MTPLVLPEHHPRLLHLMPYRRGDSLTAIKHAARSRRVWGIDQNLLCTADDIPVVMHWPKLWKGGWRWEWTGELVGKGKLRREKRRRVPKGRRGDTVSSQPWSVVSRRRTRRWGGQRPYQARTHMAVAAAEDVPLMLEAKGSPGLHGAKVWRQLRADQLATGARVGVMTLPTLRGGWTGALHRLDLAHTVGGFPVAVLPRGPKPAWWDDAAARIGVRWWGTGRRRNG